MSASSSSSAVSNRGDDSSRGAIEAKIDEVEEDIGKVKGERDEIKAEISLYKAYASLDAFDNVTDTTLEKFKAFSEDRAIMRNALQFFLGGDKSQLLLVLNQQLAGLQQQLAGYSQQLAELQGTLKEYERGKNALRDEKARREAWATSPGGSMFKLELKLTLSSDSHPFRIALWHFLKKRNLTVAGTCSRVGREVTIKFFFGTPEGSHGVKGILENLFRDYYNADPPTIEAPASLEEAVAALDDIESVPRDDRVLGRPWRYSPESDKRSPHASPCKRPREDEEGWVEAPETFQRKIPTGSQSSGSSDNKQRAHILFENKHQEDMKNIIELADDECDMERTEEERNNLLAELCRLKHDLDYNVHLDFDNLRFFWSWDFSHRDSDGGVAGQAVAQIRGGRRGR